MINIENSTDFDENVIYSIETEGNNLNYNIYLFMKNLFIMMGVVVGSFSIAIIAVSNLLFKNINKEYKSNFGYDSDTDSENEEEYKDKYWDKYEMLEDKKLSIEELDLLKNIFIEDKSPRGIIKMGYDISNNSFSYFCDTKDLSYNYLETVGRLFVIKNNCKNIFINRKEEIGKATKINEQNIKNNDENKEGIKEVEKKEPSVFAVLKTYTNLLSKKKR